MILVNKSKISLGVTQKPPPKDRSNAHPSNPSKPTPINCHICGKDDHILSTDMGGNRHCDYVSCKTFVEWSCDQRRSELQKRHFCLTCLSPGVKHRTPHSCCSKYVCPDPFHKSFKKGFHVLVCEDHKNSQANVNLLQQYMKNFIEKRGTFHDFTRNISLLCTVNTVIPTPPTFEKFSNVIPDISDRAIFPLQTIDVEGLPLRVFYDRGAGDAVLKWTAVEALQKLGRAVLVQAGSITMSGVDGVESVTPYGMWSICLPLKDGRNIVITGVCMEQVTMEFPSYELKDVESGLIDKCRSLGGDYLVQQVPKLSSFVGGETDILLGSKYLKVHPREIWRCEDSGLSVSDSFFCSVDGTTGVMVPIPASPKWNTSIG